MMEKKGQLPTALKKHNKCEELNEMGHEDPRALRQLEHGIANQARVESEVAETLKLVKKSSSSQNIMVNRTNPA